MDLCDNQGEEILDEIETLMLAWLSWK